MLRRQNLNSQIYSRFTPVTDLKVETYLLIPNVVLHKGISRKFQPLRKGLY